MSARGHEASKDVEGGASARVADVLKSTLERHLFVEDPVPLMEHGSHVVSVKLEPGAEGQDEGQVGISWDDERFREFAERLSKLREPAGAL